jgi:hypothetical protein
VSFLGGGELWVDKYAPKSFTQLLSPEKINREVLKALKKWDRFVFKSEHHQPGRVRHLLLCKRSMPVDSAQQWHNVALIAILLLVMSCVVPK